MNTILKILSSITEKIADIACVEFCDGKYHWANVDEVKIFDGDNKLFYERDRSGRVWMYEYSGHKIVASTKEYPSTITNVFSADNQRKIYVSEDTDGEVTQETWYEYNEQNKLVRTKKYSAGWTFVDYEYNQNGVLEKTIETHDINESIQEIFYNEKGLMTEVFDRIVTDKSIYFVTEEYKYDDANNLISYLFEGRTRTTYEYDNENNKIREKHHDGSEVLFKTVSKKKDGLTIKKVYTTYRHPGKEDCNT